MDNISKHISYSEATKSNTAIKHGISNDPDALQIVNMKRLANDVFEPVRKQFNKPIRVNSFFRSEPLNVAIGGASGSQHQALNDSSAIDIDGDLTGVSNADMFHYIKDNLLFDQLIWEFGSKSNPSWLHISLKKDGNRRQVLRAYKDNNGKSRYIPFDL